MDDRSMDDPQYQDRDDYRDRRFRRSNLWWPIFAVVLLLVGLWAFGNFANNPNLNLDNPPTLGEPGAGVGGGPENSPTATPTPTPEESVPLFEEIPSTESGGV